ncbi:hypothetical protein [Rhodoferax sp. GW822-FHT02A01]|uniref:hypothetical protein n=1 Tax=Rhodoferax sp. GW822-FHT02A01 TaxID=3141537 RepID=UPI00315D2C8F
MTDEELDKQWLIERCEEEEGAQNRIEVDKSTSNLHPLVSELRDDPKRYEGRRSRYFSDRSNAILSALIHAAERRNCRVSVSTWYGNVLFDLETTQIGIYLRLNKECRLTLTCERTGGGRKDFVDSDRRQIEGRLNEVFILLYGYVYDRREPDRQLKAKREQHAIANRVYEEITRQRAIDATARKLAEEQKRQEAAKEQALLEEARLWRDSQLLRSYAESIRVLTNGQHSPELVQWLEWATATADRIDPVPKRVNSLCGEQV